MSTDSIADLLTRIRNGLMAGHKTVRVRYSKMAGKILSLLEQEGYIESYEETKEEGNSFPEYKVFLKYTRDGMPVIEMLDRVSKPGRRVYVRNSDLPKVKCGLGIAIISTSQGIMTDREARKRGIGGEVLATVF
ncbi:MAG: 30S ribosomal protein S8 [Candidatus Dadabacteria bacterium]|nr:MAG: 30S ribosomal protein S8 [Candidatus Dadabacteria bacterium]